MVNLREIQRTAVFAWSPGAAAPFLVTGTRTGAVNDDFSSETKLELWDLALDNAASDAELKLAGSITTDSGFNDIAWSEPSDDHPLGVIAGALDNGSVDLWDAAKLMQGSSEAFLSRTTKHSGPVKALQWNPYRHTLLASVGTKGEIFVYDLKHMGTPFRLGTTAARADDIVCLDWNKLEKTSHILATGSSGGFVTVWDAKQKKDILTLNNQGRKAVSAVAWDPEESTKLATATANDQEPLIYLWSLRNSSAPEQTLAGHDLGVLGLSWCLKDPELLLSCGKDNRTICWNPRTGERYGEFAAGSNWAFQSTWNPHNPGLIASASFDGKILITSTQNTNSKPEDQAASNQALDGEDFFAKAQSQPQGISFSLPKAPKWAARPVSVSFGFGGQLVRVGTDASGKSKVAIETFAVDTSIGEAAQEFEGKLKSGDLAGLCDSKIESAKTDEEKADWQVIQTLHAGKSRKKLREYMGFNDEDTDLDNATKKLSINGDDSKPKTNGDDDDFFGTDEDDDNFLANLAATKGAKTNNPFQIYTDSESEADKSITRALMLGQFEKALDVCLREDRMSDAFMIAVCGGQQCIDKAQSAYLKKKAKGPNYLRLLASIVGKNLWDVVHNADLQDWKDVMATLCTYADETEFADLCEALGDRLDEASQKGDKSHTLRRDASFCYLAGSKLEKVVNNWVQELQEQEKAALETTEEGENDFSVHAKCLQGFIEKVAVFRQVAKFQDAELQATEDWKLAPLYSLYAEYADILAAHGQLASAEQYLNQIPRKFGGAQSAHQRVSQASKKATVASHRQPAGAAQRQPSIPQTRQVPTVQLRQPSIAQPSQQAFPPAQPLVNQARNVPAPYAPNGAPAAPATQNAYAPPANAYTPAGYQPQQQQAPGYGQQGSYGGYQPAQQPAPLAPPPRGTTSSPSLVPAAQAKNVGDWNDMPAGFLKERLPNSRRGTPAPGQGIASPFPNAQPNMLSPGIPGGHTNTYVQPRQQAPLPPPPKVGESPSRITSPLNAPPPMQRPTSSAASAYAPPPQAAQSQSQFGGGSSLPPPMAPPVARGASPYQPPPSTSNAAPSNRYAPAPGSQPSNGPGGMQPQQRQVAPNPYAAQQPSAYGAASQQGQGGYGQQPPPQAQAAPPPRGPARAPPPPQPSYQSQTPTGGPPNRGVPAPSVQPPPQPQTNANPTPAYNAPPPPPSAPQKQKHPRGDRSHISPTAQPIIDNLSPTVAHIKTVAPQSFKPQVDDIEKRINILFDHLNNDDLLQPDTVQQMVAISECVRDKQWERAQALFAEMAGGGKLESEGAVWMAGVKRMIAIGKISK